MCGTNPASVQDVRFRLPCIAKLTLHLVGHQGDAAHVLPLGPSIGLDEFQFMLSHMIDHVSDPVSRGSMITTDMMSGSTSANRER